MEELPTPLSRVELYLAKAAGMDVTPPEPKSRLELFLAKIAGMDVEMPAPLSLKEMWLAQVAGSAPIEPLAIEGAFYIDNQKVDVRYLAVAAGVIGATLPEKPQNRKEQYWAVIASGGPIVGVLKYVTGTNITLTDVVSGIEELQFVYGDTYQQTYSGANLYNYTDISATIGDGITTDSNGWITCTYDNSAGTSNHYSNYYTKPLALTPSTNYALVLEIRSVSGTGQIEGGGANTASQVEYFKIDFANMTAGSTIVVPITSKSDVTGANGLCSYFRFNAGQSGSVTVRISVLADTSVTPETFVYQPYTGGIPAPNPDYPQAVQTVTGEQTVTIGDGVSSQTYPLSLTGKNLFLCPESTTTSNTAFTRLGDNAFNAQFTKTNTSNQSAFTKIKIEGLKPNTSYIASYQYSLTGTNWNNAGKVRTQIDGVWSSQFYTNQISFTTNATTDDVWLVFSNAQNVSTTGSNSIDFTNIQVEKGSTPTPYAPYYNYELCKLGDYQDYIYKSGDDWYVHKEVDKYVFDGDESWMTTPYGTNSWILINVIYFNFVSNKIQIMSNIATGIAHADRNTTTPNLMYSGQNNGVNYRNTSFTTLSSLQAATKDSYVYYAIASPTDTKITDATLVGQLNAIDSAVLPKPVAYITVGATNPNLPAPIKISYYGESE